MDEKTATINIDDQFCQYIINNLFNDGIHTWWIIGAFGSLTIVTIIFSFIAAFVDADLLFKRPTVITISARRDANAMTSYQRDCTRLRKGMNLSRDEFNRVANMAYGDYLLDS